MTMFASQKINTDPNPPYVVAGYGRKNGKPVTWRGEARDDDHAIEMFDAAYPGSDPHTYGQIPRKEFNNNPNPVLIAFRADIERVRAEYKLARPFEQAVAMWVYAFAALDAFGGYALWEHPKNVYHALTLASVAELDHARKVLQRLAAL